MQTQEVEVQVITEEINHLSNAYEWKNSRSNPLQQCTSTEDAEMLLKQTQLEKELMDP